MHYVISDIHGCGTEFEELLRVINFSKKDILYVIGDIIDRGQESIKALSIIANNKNMIPLLGNHELMMLKNYPAFIKKNNDEILSMNHVNNFQFWAKNGGDNFLEEMKELSAQERTYYLDFIANFPVELRDIISGKEYLFIHSLPNEFPNGIRTELFHYEQKAVEEILFGRPDYKGRWEGDVTVIVGHTPTFKFGDECCGCIFKNGALIDIDCGCVYGEKLAAYCLETKLEFYVERKNNRG